jgi:hypothetical protein
MPTSKNSEASLAVKLAAGAQKHLSTFTQVVIGSSTFTPAQVVTELQDFAALRTSVDTAKAAVKAALQDEQSKGPALRAFIIAFIAFVRAAYGNSPDVLADFGLNPKKVRKPLTAEEQAAAVAKRNATREARGTKGKKAKASIHGNVTGVTITPVTAPAETPPAAAAPAAAQPAAPNASGGNPAK